MSTADKRLTIRHSVRHSDKSNKQGSVDAAQLVTFMCNGVTARLTDAGFVALRVMRYESGGGPRYALQPSWRTALRVTSMCGCCVTRYTKTAV